VSSTQSPLHSEISWKTKAELHLRPGERAGTSAWWFRDDANNVVALDQTHTLIVEYGEEGPPTDAVELTVVNTTGAEITLSVTSAGNAVVTPSHPQRIPATGHKTWSCKHGGGEVCSCTSQFECRCGTWSVTAPAGTDVTIPDPTFKVRWQAHVGR